MEIQNRSIYQFAGYPECSNTNINIFKWNSILYSVILFQLLKETSSYWLIQKAQGSSPQSIFSSDKKKKRRKKKESKTKQNKKTVRINSLVEIAGWYLKSKTYKMVSFLN